MIKRKDVDPSYKNYSDQGCEYAPSCLSCPYPECLWDLTYEKRMIVLGQGTHVEIIRLFYKDKKTAEEITKIVGCSAHTVKRVLRDYRDG